MGRGRKRMTDEAKKLTLIKRLEKKLAELKKEVDTRPYIEKGIDPTEKELAPEA